MGKCGPVESYTIYVYVCTYLDFERILFKRLQRKINEAKIVYECEYNVMLEITIIFFQSIWFLLEHTKISIVTVYISTE